MRVCRPRHQVVGGVDVARHQVGDAARAVGRVGAPVEDGDRELAAGALRGPQCLVGGRHPGGVGADDDDPRRTHSSVALAHEVDLGLGGVALDLGDLVVGERRAGEGVEVGVELLDARGPDHGAGHPLVAQHPLERELGELLPAPLGDAVEVAHPREHVVLQPGDGRVVACGPRVRRHAVEVAVGQQPLRQRGEDDAAHPLRLELVEQARAAVLRLLDPAVEQAVGRLVDQQRRAEVAGDLGRLLGLRRGVRRDADVERATGPDRRVERHHRLLDRRLGVEAVAVEDVDVVEPHPGERLVERGEDVLPRAAALAVGPRPHVVAGLRRDDQLVAVGREVVGEVAPEVLLGAAVGRPVVVGEVEVGDAAVEGAAQDRALRLLGPVGAEVLPEPERERGQLQPAPPGVAVGHPGRVVVPAGRSFVGHGPHPAACARAR